nr:bile acid:sodium symporter family protein [uncultured Blautia sp.]
MLNRFNQYIQKKMAFITPICLILGVCFSDIAKHGLPLVPWVFAFMTFAGALKSSFRDVANVFRTPKVLLVSLAVIHIFVPCIACGLGHLIFPDNANLIAGMVLEFSVPTAVSGLMWITVYDGNSPLSLSLVVIDTILAPFAIPVALQLLLGSRITMDVGEMMSDLIFMVAIPAIAAMCLNQISKGKVKETWPSKLAPFSKLALMYVVTCNSSKIAPYVKSMNAERILVALVILVLAAGGYVLGWFVARIMKQDQETTVSLIYGIGMRNISTGAVIAAAYFPGEVVFPVMIGTLFQQVLAATFGKVLIDRRNS